MFSQCIVSTVLYLRNTTTAYTSQFTHDHTDDCLMSMRVRVRFCVTVTWFIYCRIGFCFINLLPFRPLFLLSHTSFVCIAHRR